MSRCEIDQLLRGKRAKPPYCSGIKGTLTACRTCLDAKPVLFSLRSCDDRKTGVLVLSGGGFGKLTSAQSAKEKGEMADMTAEHRHGHIWFRYTIRQPLVIHRHTAEKRKETHSDDILSREFRLLHSHLNGLQYIRKSATTRHITERRPYRFPPRL